ncbi:phage tail tube protein [Clostridium sp.]|uniref:phage tail tube protein n=1 Tax=Clostridium sp. TaxID=1506 RepID=UPI00283F1D51|nr:phage tail tube protein [Clostridium sp.]MDR3595102.1 phage tail tube protein [Clostridium sp.]
MSFNGERVINGSYGEMWIDGDQAGETSALKAEITRQKTKIVIPGQLATDTKTVSTEGKGTIKLLKVYSRMIQKQSDDLDAGKETVCTLVSNVADPDAFGAERIAILDAKFDSLTLIDWETGKTGEETIPFTFTKYKKLDTITPQ